MNHTTRPMSMATKMRLKGVTQRRSNFSTSWTDTEALLHREIRLLGAFEYVMEIDMDERYFRIDGNPRANAVANSPAVAISFEDATSPMEFLCGDFYAWQDNVLAIAKGLEALRMIERYGITHAADQYAGFKALGSGIAMPAAQMTVEEAVTFMLETSGGEWRRQVGRDGWTPEVREMLRTDPAFRGKVFKVCAQGLHPDAGGDPVLFDKLVKARDLLEAP